tara:strand:+ start:2477 stop:2875 length:399 start_codon:yes stop_codon:yes gene_type:complete
MRELLYRLEADPQGHYISTGHYGGVDECEEHCKEWAGYIPHIFAEAVMISDERGDVTLDTVAQAMNDVYGMGGFMYPMGGEVDPVTGVYSYPGESDLFPLVDIRSHQLRVLVYPYGIVALTDGDCVKTARFD